jgi:hypothetical protein
MRAPVGSVTTNPTAQEVLAYPFRQRLTTTTTTTTVPGHLIYRRRQCCRQLISHGCGWGTVMRHFLLSEPVTALPFGVGVTPRQAVLIPATGGKN